mmetsp:Transcript_22897/g.52454  ORF Transcript_22897/g.52454 Transcript_22897/m.52454 type:complete len:593 (+) Transcript_22897:101-1879(+)
MGGLEDQSIEVFRKFDRSGGGLIKQTHLATVIEHIVPGCDPNEVIACFRADAAMDKQSTGDSSSISYTDFITWLFKDDASQRKKCRGDGSPVQTRAVTSEQDGGVTSLEGVTVEYLTDVEGNWEYFLRYVALSTILYWDECSQHERPSSSAPVLGRLSLRTGGILVFGGDATDKGPGDIRFVRCLVSLKLRFPHQVYIILGNRDIQPLRYYAELTAAGLEQPFVPYWLTGDKLKTFDEYRHEQNLPPTALSMLKWMHLWNMGCPTTLETRKKEVELLRNAAANDMDVLESFRNSVDPHGEDPWMLQLVKLGQLGLVLGDALFVHAGLHDKSIGYVPGEHDRRTNCVREWVQKLNAWKDDQVREYESNAAWYRAEDGCRHRGGERLLDYGVPNGAEESSVAYFNPFQDGNPQQFSEYVQGVLKNSGIRRVFSGHQPHGESPVVIRHPATGVVALLCDTSYSDQKAPKESNIADNRGKAVSVVSIKAGVVHIHGVLADETKHECKVWTETKDDKVPDCLVGRQLSNGAWIKTVLPGSASAPELFQAVAAKGRDLDVSTLSMKDALPMLLSEHHRAIQHCLEPSGTGGAMSHLGS